MAGFAAVLMWALLALFTDASGAVPPFLLAGLCFSIGTVIGLIWLSRNGGLKALSGVPPVAWIVGIAGLFGYHFLYFTALRNAPAVDAGLIAYLWPLLIVVGSALLPGERLRWFHVVGALLGLFGAALIVTRGEGLSFDPRFAFGYAMAGLCALTWSSYSLLSRRLADVPTAAVTGFCAGTAVLAFVCHVLLEETVWPADMEQWLAVIGLGLMPVGAAFYVWDLGVKRGNIQIIGAASYAAPLLSTIVLILAGRAEATGTIVVACLLITGGAALAAKEMILRPDKGSGG